MRCRVARETRETATCSREATRLVRGLITTTSKGIRVPPRTSPDFSYEYPLRAHKTHSSV